MTVDYQLELADLVEIAKDRRHQFRSDSLSRLYYMGILPALGVGLALAIESFPTAAVFMVLFIASGWFVQHYIQRAYTRTVYSEQNFPLSMRQWSATFTNEGIRFSSDATTHLYRWPFIRQVFRGARFVHIEVTPVQKVHIPIQAFRDEQHIEQFIQEAQSHVKSPAT